MSLQLTSFCFGEKYNMFCCSCDDFTFVFDCGRDMEYTLSGSKEDPDLFYFDLLKNLDIIDWAKVDFILISNFEQVHLLPYITECTRFSGSIYITESAKEYTRHVLEEKVLIRDSLSINSDIILSQLTGMQCSDINSHSKLGFQGPQSCSSEMGVDLFMIERCFEKLVSVNYNTVICPLSSLKVYCKSSGYSIGSANWNIEFQDKKIALIGSSSLVPGLHPQEFDKSVFNGVDICLFSSMQTPSLSSSGASRSKAISQFCSQAVACLKAKGVAIVVCEPFGIAYDLLDGVYKHMKSINLHGSQFWFISPVAKKSIQLGNIMGEWLCSSKKKLLYNPEYPFSNKELAEKGLIQFFNSVEDLAHQQQVMNGCVIFVSPFDIFSISFLVSFYGRTSNNRILFIDEAHKQSICSKVFIPQRLDTHDFELDTRILPQEVNHFLADSGIRNVVLPSHVKPGFSSYTSNSGSKLKGSSGTNISWYSHLDVVEVKFQNEMMTPIQISKDITKNKRKFETSEYEYICNVEGEITFENNLCTLLPTASATNSESSNSRSLGIFSNDDLLLGLDNKTEKDNTDLNELSSRIFAIVQGLSKFGFVNQGMDKGADLVAVNLESEFGGISITISKNEMTYKSNSEYANSCLLSVLKLI